MEFRVQSFDLLPLALERCPECMTRHPLNTPHDKDTSTIYQCIFYAKYGRWPIWADAMAHCNQSYG